MFGKKAYIKDSWNKLDFLIVVTSDLSYFLNSDSLKSLRTLRILRPLRLFSRIKSLGKMLNAIILSFIPLKDIFIVQFFYYTLFAIAGLMVF